MKSKASLLNLALLIASCGVAHAQFTTVSLELNHIQTGAATTSVSGSVFFAEVQGYDNT